MVGRNSGILKFIVITSIIFTLIYACVPVNYTSGNSNLPALQFKNVSYINNVGTVRLLSFKGRTIQSTNRPVIELGSNENLRLTFDLLESTNRNLQFRIEHINHNWSEASTIQAMDYLVEYNQFPINNFEYSFDTKLKYVHYECSIPAVKISGNYLIVVYQNNNPDDIILSERFMVYEEKSAIGYNMGVSSLTQNRRTHQEIDFTVQLKDLNVVNPARDIIAEVRQNNNWLMAKRINEPFQIENNRLVYRYYDGQLNFFGGNEFRFADISSINFQGTNVANIEKKDSIDEMNLRVDNDRSQEAYREWDDRNGRFVIGNREIQSTELVADYIMVGFNLDVPEQNQPIYAVGEFSKWQLSNKYKLRYNDNKGSYELSVPIKQSYFEYMYFTDSKPFFPFEGNHDDTENEYDILIYYSNPQVRYDKLIGYTHFNSRSVR